MEGNFSIIGRVEMCTFLANISRYHVIFIRFLWGFQKSTPNLTKIKIGLVFLGYNWAKKSVFDYFLILCTLKIQAQFWFLSNLMLIFVFATKIWWKYHGSRKNLWFSTPPPTTTCACWRKRLSSIHAAAFFLSFLSSFWEDVGKTNILDEFASRLRLVDYPHGVMFHIA